MRTRQPALSPKMMVQAVTGIFAGTRLHAKQVLSLAYGVVGAAHAPRASVAGLGTAMATARGTNVKHGIKQVDRLLGNEKIDDEAALAAHARFVLGPRSRVVTSLDWTDYADSGQHRIALNLVTRHGRATPLLWKTVTDAELTGRRNEHEDELLRAFARVRPTTLRDVIILADRGFGDVALYELLEYQLGFHFVIRFRACIAVQDQHGVTKRAGDWVPAGGRVCRLVNARLTRRRYQVASVVAVQEPRMKEPWLLASSLGWTGKQLVEMYGRRFTCEENFRDEKDPRFGLGSHEVDLSTTARRDRHVLLVALAITLLTLLGAAGERLGLDRQLRANTAKRRTHSLFRQGREYLRGAVGKMPNVVAHLRAAFTLALENHARVHDVWATI
jgi:hypothetical protein